MSLHVTKQKHKNEVKMLPGIGLFGTGPDIHVLVSILREKGFKIEAIWGRTIKEAEDVSKELNIPFFTNKIDDVLLKKDVDLVFINCPPFLHSQISVKALGIGKHVVCDKPCGLGQADALKMVRGAQYYPMLITLINHSLRFLPAFSQMKKALQDEYVGPRNEIGLMDIRIQMGSLLHNKYDWLCDEKMGGGALNLIGSHVVDLVSFLLGRAVRVHGLVRTYTKVTQNVNGIRQISAPDFVNFQMELEGGTLVTASLHTNVTSKTFVQEVMICGRDGNLVVRGGDLFGQKKISEREEALYVDVQDLHCSTSDAHLPKPYIKGLCKMVSALRESFASDTWVKEPVQAAATFEDGLYVQAVLDAIRKSSDTRSWVKVSIISESPTNHAKILNATRMSAVIMH